MRDVRRWFEDALSIADEVERAGAVGDLAFDADALASEGMFEEAIALAELLTRLDEDDDMRGSRIADHAYAHGTVLLRGARSRQGRAE